MMMEFEEDHDEEEEEEDEDEDKDHHHHHNNNNNIQEINFTPTTSSAAEKRVAPPVRYRECLKNHAVGIGGHAVDGCGEFMPAGVEGTLDALKCAACNCHRNFHRKELLALDATSPSLSLWTPPPPPPPPHPRQQFPHHPHFYPYNRTTPSPTGYLHVSQSSPRPPPLALPSPSSVPGREASGVVGGGDGSGVMMMMTSSSGKKRHRTKFTQEQKDKMLELAERLGWRMQKEDEELVQQFCNESGVKRHVLKVWMHNNKHTLGKKT